MVKKRVVFTGGSGRFGQTLKKNFDKSKFDIFFPLPMPKLLKLFISIYSEIREIKNLQ